MNDLQDLMRQNVASPPPDDTDLTALVGAGRRRVRVRRTALAGVSAAVVAGVLVGGAALTGIGAGRRLRPGCGEPAAATGRADAPPDRRRTGRRGHRLPVADLAHEREPGQRQRAVPRRGHRRRAGPVPRRAARRPAVPALRADGPGHRRQGLAAGPGPRPGQRPPGRARRRPAGAAQRQRRPAASRVGGGLRPGDPGVDHDLVARAARGAEFDGIASHDGRLYLRVLATAGQIPEGGWPTQADGDAEDADAEGSTYNLWSVSLDGPARTSATRAWSSATSTFTDSSMVWTDSTKGDAGAGPRPRPGDRRGALVRPEHRRALQPAGLRRDRRADRDEPVLRHVRRRRPRRPGADPHHGRRAGGHPPGHRGRRLAARPDSDVVTVSAYRADDEAAPTSTTSAPTGSCGSATRSRSWGTGRRRPADRFFWDTPVNNRNGATQWLGELLPTDARIGAGFPPLLQAIGAALRWGTRRRSCGSWISGRDRGRGQRPERRRPLRASRRSASRS